MKTNLNTEKYNKENLKILKKEIEGNKSLYFFLYKKINTFYEFNEEKYANIFYNSVYKFNIIQKKYNEYNKINNNLETLKQIEKNNIKIIGVGGYGQVYKIDNNFCIKISLSKKNFYHEYFIAKKISKKKDLKKNIINPQILIKTNNFYGLVNFFHINILFIYLTYCHIKEKNIQEDEIKKKIKTYDIENEYRFLYRNENRHIVSEALKFFDFLFLYFFNNDNFYINMIHKFLKILNSFKEYEEGEEKKGYMIVMPLADSMASNIFLNKETLKLDINGIKGVYVFPYIYRMLFLQVSLFYLNTNKYFFYSHNDLKPDNILVTEEFKPYTISYQNNYFYFKENFRFKIADFDFSKIIYNDKNEIDINTINKKIKNSRLDNVKSWIFDIHFFIHKLTYYIGKEETEIDKDFFFKLHELFIKPFCKIKFNDLHSFIKIKIKKTNDVCDKGYLYTDKNPDISLLINFLISDYFKIWLK